MKSFLKKLLVIPAVVAGLYGVLVVVDNLTGDDTSSQQLSEGDFSFSLSSESDEAARADIQRLVESYQPASGVNLFGNDNALSELSSRLEDPVEEATAVSLSQLPSAINERNLHNLGVGGGQDDKSSVIDILIAAYINAQRGDQGAVDEAIKKLEAKSRSLEQYDVPSELREIVDVGIEVNTILISYLEEIKKAPQGKSFDDIIAPRSVEELELRTENSILSIFEYLRIKANEQ